MTFAATLRRRRSCWRIILATTLFCFLGKVLHTSADEPITQKIERGPVVVDVKLEPPNPLIGDTVTLTITATAKKDVELLMPEFGAALDRFRIVEFVPRERLGDDGGIISTQTYRLQPAMSGKQVVPAIMIEFVDDRSGEPPAPEGEDAYEILTERIEFEVQSVLPDDATAELRPPLGELQKVEPASSSPRWSVVGCIVVFLVATPFLWKAFVAYQRRARRRSAYDIATSKLNRLLATTKPEQDIGAFYVELSAIVRRYLEDRFDLRAPELTTEEFLGTVGESENLSRDHTGLLREFLRQADLVKFAGVTPSSDDVQRSVDAAKRFLEETREDAPLIDEEAEGDRKNRAKSAAGAEHVS